MTSISASNLSANELTALVRDALLINRLYIAALAWVVYENIITLDQEIVYMWYWSKWIELGRVLFFLNRYGIPVVFIPQIIGNIMPYPNESYCHAWNVFGQFASLGNLAIVQVSLMLRTWALFGAHRNMLIGLSIVTIACAFAIIVILSTTGGDDQFLIDPTLTMIGCDNILPLNDRYYTAWIPVVVFDFVMCILSIYKVLEHKRDDVHSPLVDLLHRDGLLYFVISLSLGIVNTCMYAMAPLHLKALGVPIMSSALCVACSRMLLNVRALGETGQPTVMSEGPPPIHASFSTPAHNNNHLHVGEHSYTVSLA